MKLDLEIAIYQQARAGDPTFEWVPDHHGQLVHFLIEFNDTKIGLIMPNHLIMPNQSYDAQKISSHKLVKYQYFWIKGRPK